MQTTHTHLDDGHVERIGTRQEERLGIELDRPLATSPLLKIEVARRAPRGFATACLATGYC